MSGANNPSWQGGKGFKDGQGYIKVYLPLSSPFCSMRAKGQPYIPEHRLVMAQHIGRLLKSWEIVHHINGDKTDNRLENLELLPKQADHLPYTKLQQRIIELEKQVRLLQWQVKLIQGEKIVLERNEGP